MGADHKNHNDLNGSNNPYDHKNSSNIPNVHKDTYGVKNSIDHKDKEKTTLSDHKDHNNDVIKDTNDGRAISDFQDTDETLESESN